MKNVVARDRIFIDPSALEWAGIAAMKKVYKIFQERGFRARPLVAAFRNVLQWSEFQGADMVVSPPFKWQEIINASDYEPVSRIDVPV
ncbi:transaldolase family protein, partial [Streptococcus anginosus]|nr:transaldolase family protein [Streptococcus anginosus]